MGIGFVEWATFADALVVLIGIIADDIRLFHFHTELLFGEVDGREDRQIGVALAAASLAVLLLVAYCTLHEFIRFQILQRCLANQTFFFHYQIILFSNLKSPSSWSNCSGILGSG